MSGDANKEGPAPYGRDRFVDKPGIVGARWWHATLVDQDAQIARRAAIRGILVAGGVIAGLGAMLAMYVKATSTGPDVSYGRKTSLDMQKEYGWSFGAVGEPLVFDGVTTRPFQPDALAKLPTDLAPASRALVAYFQSTLFQSPGAAAPLLGKLDPSEVAGFVPLTSAMKPIFMPAMVAAYARGKSLASLFASVRDEGSAPASTATALIVDLDGPAAVAFAAGASAVFDPVFLFDNWPHPRGVVRAQETLSAAAYYQPLFAEGRSAMATDRLPMFVLDRRRMATYSDDATQFDNRYVAKLPPAVAAMRALGVTHLLYVVPTRADATRELDDLNDPFLLYVAGGLDVRALSLDLFDTDKSGGANAPARPGNESDELLADAGFVYYGGSAAAHHSFFTDYPWAKPARAATARIAVNPGKSYAPVARATPYSSGKPQGSPVSRPSPVTFATVPVVVAVGTGVMLGARYSRSGSWNRSSGGFGG